MLLLLILPATISAFFFPSSGNGCSCACTPAPPCPPMPTCAIPGPCPSYPASGWTTGVRVVPAIPAVPAMSAPIEPIPYSQSLTIMSPSGCSSSFSPSCHGGSSIPVSVPAPPTVYMPAASQTYVQPSYIPQPSYVAQPPISPPYVSQPLIQASYAPSPVMGETQEDRIIEVVAQQTVPPTLLPPVAQPPTVATSYDDTVPPLPPPIPSTPIAEYKTTETIIPTVEYQSSYAPKEQYEETTGVHSGESDFPKVGRKVSTEGFMEPLNILNRRNLILKRMRNVRTMGTTIPHTNATCNSNKLANVMARAIVPDVSVAKRMVMRSAELAFDGAKFDVFCATGEFSYSIHSRKYCEVTRDEVTCFAFR